MLICKMARSYMARRAAVKHFGFLHATVGKQGFIVAFSLRNLVVVITCAPAESTAML